jgi:hypothetical protein
LWPDVRVLLISSLPVDHTGQSLDPRTSTCRNPSPPGTCSEPSSN